MLIWLNKKVNCKRNNIINIMDTNSKLSAARRFGIFFSIISAFTLSYFYINNNILLIIIFSFITVFLLFTATFIPKTLIKFNELWMSLGYFLGRIANPIILGGLFFAIISPIAIVTKLFGRDELKLKKDYKNSYWIEKNHNEFNLKSFKNQY